eukprot:2546504-Pleurochrysis_carterae.AAC.2
MKELDDYLFSGARCAWSSVVFAMLKAQLFSPSPGWIRLITSEANTAWSRTSTHATHIQPIRITR